VSPSKSISLCHLEVQVGLSAPVINWMQGSFKVVEVRGGGGGGGECERTHFGAASQQTHTHAATDWNFRCRIVHAIIIAQCITHRSRPHSSCADCAHHPPGANPENAGDEEEALLGPEAAPESSLPQEYRDEEIEDSTAHF